MRANRLSLWQSVPKGKKQCKTLVQHYRQLKKMKDTSVYDPDTVTDLTLAGIFDYILDECRKEEFELTSTKRIC